MLFPWKIGNAVALFARRMQMRSKDMKDIIDGPNEKWGGVKAVTKDSALVPGIIVRFDDEN